MSNGHKDNSGFTKKRNNNEFRFTLQGSSGLKLSSQNTADQLLHSSCCPNSLIGNRGMGCMKSTDNTQKQNNDTLCMWVAKILYLLPCVSQNNRRTVCFGLFPVLAD